MKSWVAGRSHADEPDAADAVPSSILSSARVIGKPLGAHKSMNTRSYSELPDEYFERYFETYRELCSKTLRVWLTLLLGVVGQGFALSSLFEVVIGHRLLWLATAMTFVPFLIYIVLVFIRVPPPISPRAYRWLLLIVVWWNVANAVVSVVATPVWSRTAPGGWTSVAVVWACVATGLMGIVTIGRYLNKFRNLERAFGYLADRERGA